MHKRAVSTSWNGLLELYYFLPLYLLDLNYQCGG